MEEQQGDTGHQEHPGHRHDDEIDLIDLIAVIVRRRWLIIWVIVLFTVMGGVSGYFADPPPFRAEVNLLAVEPPRLDGRTTPPISPTMISGFGIGQIVLSTLMPNPRSHGDSITVLGWLGGQTIRRALQTLNDRTVITQAEGGLISIAVTDKDSLVAAGMSNAYVYALTHYFKKEKQIKADEELDYIDSRLLEVERWLREAEDSLLTFRARNRGRLDTERYLEWRQRRVSSWENVYNNLLSRQEAIRIEAQRGRPDFRVLSYASAEDAERAGPSLRKRLMLGTGVGVLVALLAAFVVDYGSRVRSDGRLRQALQR